MIIVSLTNVNILFSEKFKNSEKVIHRMKYFSKIRIILLQKPFDYRFINKCKRFVNERSFDKMKKISIIIR